MSGGYGWTQQRPDSQVVRTDQEYAQAYQDWASSFSAAQKQADAQAQNQSNLINSVMQDTGLDQGRAASWLQTAFDAGGGKLNFAPTGWSATTQALASQLPSSLFSNPNSAAEVGSFSSNRQQGDAQWQQLFADRAANQGLQADAYRMMRGGGFNGGLLNDSYAQPFSNVLGGNPAGEQSGFTSGMMAGQSAAPTTNLGMGFGGAGTMTAPSTGAQPFAPMQAPNNGMSTGTPMPMQVPPQAPDNGVAAAWGGPFSAKNPWSFG